MSSEQTTKQGSVIPQEQVMEQLKLLLPAIGGVLTMLGVMTPAESAKWITTIMNAVGPALILGGMIWGILDKRQKSIIAKADVVAKDPTSPLQGLVMQNSPDGKEIARDLSSQTVVAGTPEAASIAKAV